jgi:hypothetical protein
VSFQNTCFTFAPTPAPTPLAGPCEPNTALNLMAKLSRRSIKAGSTKPVRATYTLRVQGKAKSQRLANMGVTVTLPQGVAVARTPASSKRAGGTRVTVNGNQVTWYPVTFKGTKARKFRLRVTLSPPFATNAPKFFAAEVFQDSNGAATDYCPLAAPDVAVFIV